jgi:hypothetical protein
VEEIWQQVISRMVIDAAVWARRGKFRDIARAGRWISVCGDQAPCEQKLACRIQYL